MPLSPLPEALSELARLELTHLDCVAAPKGAQGLRLSRACFEEGRLIRGALGYALREVSCLGRCSSERKLCVVSGCAYARGFGEGVARQGVKQRPAVFRLTPNASAEEREGVELRFRLTLMGEAGRDSVYWLLALHQGLLRGLYKRSDSVPYELWQVRGVSGEALWDLKRAPQPKPAPTARLGELAPRPQGELSSARVTFMSPLESRSREGLDLSDRGVEPSLLALLLLIVRRLEELSALGEAPIERGSISRRALTALCEGVRVSEWGGVTLVEGNKSARAELKRQLGSISFELPSDQERAQLISWLLLMGSQVGVGRGGVEGRGAFSVSLNP